MTFAIAVLDAVSKCNEARKWLHTLAALEYPEDFSRAAMGDPASIFQLQETRKLGENGFITFVFHQCRFGADYAKPMRFVTNMEMMAKVGYLAGPPSLQKATMVGHCQDVGTITQAWLTAQH